MAMNVAKREGAIAEINVTPMADIMIVLLIIFMVITPMLQKGVDVKLPQAANTKDRKDDAKTIVVAVKKNTDTYLQIGNNPTERLERQEDLLPQVKEQLQDRAEGRWEEDTGQVVPERVSLTDNLLGTFWRRKPKRDE